MATYTITVDEQLFYVEQTDIQETECSTNYIYTIYANQSDQLDITLTGDSLNSYYILNGVQTTLLNVETAIVFDTTLTIHFTLRNSGNPGVFDSTNLVITNNDTTSNVNEYIFDDERLNDSCNCLECDPTSINDLISDDADNTLELGEDGKLYVAESDTVSGGSTLTNINIPYTACTSNLSGLLHTNYTTNATAFKFDNYNNDAWVAGNGINTNQRLVYYFGGEQYNLKEIHYQNGFQNSNSLTTSNSTFGINNVVVYALVNNTLPSTSHGVVTGDLTSIYTGTLTQQTLSTLYYQISILAIDCYGIVIDATDTHGGSYMSLRRLICKY